MYNLLKVFFKIINFYTQHFQFPHRGWKYMRSLLQFTHLDDRLYRKKIQKGVYLYVNAQDHIQSSIFWYGFYEKEVIQLWQSLIGPDSIVVDIGANVGYYTVIAAHKATKGRVFSFEPFPKLYRQLQQNISAARLQNVTALPFAAGLQHGQQPFFVSGPDNTGMSGLTPAENYSGVTETVTVVSLDEWAAGIQLPAIDFIKMDIEGAEAMALQSMKEIMHKYRPVLFVEVRAHLLKSFGQTVEGIYHLLAARQYTPYEVLPGSRLRKISGCPEGDSIVFAPQDYIFPTGIIV